MLTVPELHAKGKALYDALLADRKNNGDAADAKTMEPIKLSFEIGLNLLEAVLVTARSVDVLARKARSDMGWKPSDDIG